MPNALQILIMKRKGVDLSEYMYQDPEMRAAAQNHHEPTTVPVKVVGMKFRVGEGVKIDRGTKVWVKP